MIKTFDATIKANGQEITKTFSGDLFVADGRIQCPDLMKWIEEHKPLDSIHVNVKFHGSGISRVYSL